MVDSHSNLSSDEFLIAAKQFVEKSTKLCDGWKLFENDHETHMSYVRKETYIEHKESHGSVLFKAEYVIFYNLSFEVPSFSFNVWNSSGALLSLDDIRNICFTRINEKDFYSVVTQQEHPIFQRPYFIVHPCHTDTLLSAFKNKSNNIIVTFLGLITPLLKINLPLEYGF